MLKTAKVRFPSEQSGESSSFSPEACKNIYKISTVMLDNHFHQRSTFIFNKELEKNTSSNQHLNIRAVSLIVQDA